MVKFVKITSMKMIFWWLHKSLIRYTWMSVLYVLAKRSTKINVVYLLMCMYVHEKAHNDYWTYTYMYGWLAKH